MEWNTKVKLGMELIHEACKENYELHETCKICPFGTYCDIIWDKLSVAPNEFNWIKIGGEDTK